MSLRQLCFQQLQALDLRIAESKRFALLEDHRGAGPAHHRVPLTHLHHHGLGRRAFRPLVVLGMLLRTGKA